MTLQGTISGEGKIHGDIKKLDTLRGYSAYEVAVLNGFVGTEEEWLASLNGDDYILTDEDKQEIIEAVTAQVCDIIVGDIEPVLDSIIAQQNSYLGGEAV